jgi:O-antigen ligase
MLALAVALPLLVAYNVAPSPTILNQLSAMGLWGAALLAMASLRHAVHIAPLATAPPPSKALPSTLHATRWLLTALLTVAFFALGGALWGAVGLGLAVSATGLLLMAAALVVVGAGCAEHPALLHTVTRGLVVGWVLLGAASGVVGWVQVFAPQAADGHWIAQSAIVGRAVGNVRQPNHLATLMLGACAALVPLTLMLQARPAPSSWLRQLTAWLPLALFLPFVFVITLTGSRTGVVGVVLLALWGAFDRHLPGRWRVGLLLGPLLYVLSWWAMTQWASTTGGTFGAASRLGEADMSSSRFAILADTWTLIRQQPWWGVGFGEFNLAWSMTPLPHRPVAFFDHSHNLPLQLAVELGVPVALVVLGLLALALHQAYRQTRQPVIGDKASTVAMHAFLMMLLLMAVHSQFEYPLWYAHFLLPTAFMWGLCLGPRARVETPNASHDNKREIQSSGRSASAHPRAWPWVLAGAVMTTAAVAALIDYQKAVVIFEPQEQAKPLVERIADGQTSWFFAHHANYAWGTTADLPGEAMPAFAGAKHYLLDARLMMAWAQGYAEQGDLDRARHIADRLREFRNPATQAWFAECQSNAFVKPPFQCTPSTKALSWRAFR